MTAFEVVDEVAVDLRRARVHEAGWQTWSPTGTYGVDTPSPRPESNLRQVMQFRPGRSLPRRGYQSEGVLVVDDGLGGPARVYAPGPGTGVPTVRAQVRHGRLFIASDGPTDVALVDGGVESALAWFGDGYAARVHAPAIRPAGTVWCPWYHYFERATSADIAENLAAIDRHDLPVDVVQVDDGWEAGIGDWNAYSPGFRDLPDLVRRIHDSGRRAGIWVAPLTVGSRSRLAERHPDWLVGDGGQNWEQSVHGLDVTNPAAAGYLADALAALCDLGIDYVKLDFLYTGALPGRRHEDVDELDAYRIGLALVRRAAGDETYLLGCGAPLLPSVGLVDALRISADVLNPTMADSGADRLRGAQAIVSRSWQHGRFWVNDPDCLVARPSFPLREEWADLVQRWGGLRSASDRVEELDARGLALTRRVLSSPAPTSPLAPDTLPGPLERTP